jgi:outer membrane protein
MLNRQLFKPILTVILLILFSVAYAQQEVYQLDLKKSLAIAREKSHKMKLLKEEVKQSEYNLKAATASFKTHIDLELTTPSYTETIRKWEDSTGIDYFPVKQLEYAGDLTINQPLPTDGRIYISSGLLNTEDYEESEKSMRVFSRVGFYQPIEAFYSYNHIRSSFREAKLNYELSNKRLRRAELDLVYEISQVFYRLLSAQKQKEIASQALERQKEAYEIAQNKYNAGLIREVEALQMEVDLGEARNDYDLANVNYISQANNFKQQIGISLRDSISLESELDYEIVHVDIEKAVELGLQHRLEIREHEIEIELAEIMIKRNRSNGQVQGSVSAYYDFIGTSNDSWSTSFMTSFDNSLTALKNRPGNRGVSLNIRIPIWDWGENKSIVKALQAGLNQSKYRLDNERVTIERDIRNTVHQLKSSLRRLQLLDKNVKVAEKSFAISRHRFTNGDIDSQALALDRQRLNNAYLSRLEAYISYKLLLADIQRKTFYDFEANTSLVD